MVNCLIVVEISIAISLLAVFIATLGLIASYDRLFKKCIYHFYSPDVRAVVSLIPDSEDLVHEQVETEKSEFSIEHQDLVGFDHDRMVTLRLSISNRSKKNITCELTVIGSHTLRPREETRKPVHDFEGFYETQLVEGSDGTAKRKYSFHDIELTPNEPATPNTAIPPLQFQDNSVYGHSFIFDVDSTADSLRSGFLMV